MNSEQPESQSKKSLTYFAPSRESIERLVRAVCVDLETSGDKAPDREEMRSDLANLLEVIASVQVVKINKKSAESLDSETSQE
jgi:hypothetical protein